MAAKKILVCDDEPHILHVVAAKLKNGGFKVITAADGEEGIKKARSEKPDIIVLDIMMPKMDGYEACKRLKTDPHTKNIPVILLTGVDQAVFRTTYTQHMGMMTEADDYIAKPVEPEELTKRVEALTG